MGVRGPAARLWRAATAVGVAQAPRGAVRSVMGANHFFVIAAAVGLGWSALLAAHPSEVQPYPGVTHLLMVAGWLMCLWINARGQFLVASALGLLIPIAQYTYLTHLYGRAAGFQLVLLAVPSLAYVMFDAHRMLMRVLFSALAAVMLVWMYADGSFATPQIPTTGEWAILVAVANIASVLLIFNVLAYFNDLYLRRERERADALLTEAQEAADTDALTGVLNRRGARPIIESLARGGDFAITLIDVDRFKRVNDVLGHAAGDAVLAGVARTLAVALGDRGHLARWGGEEFLVVMPAVSAREGFAVAEGLRREVEHEFVAERTVPDGITVSAGVAFATAGTRVDSVIDAADRCLYDAKASGRNLVVAGEAA